jgi:hypothetical protein
MWTWAVDLDEWSVLRPDLFTCTVRKESPQPIQQAA